jgi:hypothetical protein
MANVIAMLDKQNDIRKNAVGKSQKEALILEKEAKSVVNQKALDQVFKTFLN